MGILKSPIYLVIIVVMAIATFLILFVIGKLRKRPGKTAKKLVTTTLDFEIDGQKGKIEIGGNNNFSWVWNDITSDIVKVVNPELAVRINALVTQRVALYLELQTGEKSNVEQQVEKITKEGVINARIYDTEHRSRSLRHVELIPGKNYGRQFLCGTYFVFALQKNGDILKPVVIPSAMDHPPSELYEALQTKEDVKEVMGNRDEAGDKIKLGLLVLAACVALFIMFMAIYNKGGG